MLAVVGHLLPFAVGVALSPTPIAAVLLMLLGPKGWVRASVFAAGSVLGIALALTLTTLAAGTAELTRGGYKLPPLVLGLALLVIGVLAVLLGYRQWRRRPRSDAEATLPRVLQGVQELRLGRAFVLGFVLSVFTAKNLTLVLAAGAIIGSGRQSPLGSILSMLIFIVIARATLIGPVIFFVVNRARATTILGSASRMLIRYNAVVTAVVLIVLGVVAFGQGLSTLG
jgi:hypothetical protein